MVYFKNDTHGYHTVSSLDSADFFRVILLPDSGDKLYNIKEFYKDGKIKLIGKSDPLYEKFKKGLISFGGTCIRYYPDGKRESITQYYKDHKEGFEEIYYPNGGIYFSIKHSLSHKTFNDEAQYWECYNPAGTMICNAGNGEWVVYDKEYKNIVFSGTVKDGYREGEWDGRVIGTDSKVISADSIKYIYKFKKGVVTSSIGYDKAGRAFPFVIIEVAANYLGGFNLFIDELNKHLSVPTGPDGKKISLENVKISFVVEKDSTISDLKTLGIVNQDLNKALAEALGKCHYWVPTRFYGIPYRTRVILPLTYVSKPFGNGESFNIPFDEEILEY